MIGISGVFWIVGAVVGGGARLAFELRDASRRAAQSR